MHGGPIDAVDAVGGFDGVDATTLAAWLVDDDEIAVLDAREQGVFLTGHLFHATCIPLSHLELELPRLVPRRDTRVVWCDGGSEGLAERAAARATALGWSNCSVLAGGVAAWSAAGNSKSLHLPRHHEQLPETNTEPMAEAL